MFISVINPCLSCGACCAFYRVSFYWTETDPLHGGTVPANLTNQVSAHFVAMKGSDTSKPRCTCLEGVVGEQVKCNIYSIRPSICREVPYSWQFGESSEKCDKARRAWNLPPLPQPNPVEPDQPNSPRAA